MIQTKTNIKSKLLTLPTFFLLVITDQLTKKIALSLKDPLNLGPITIETTYNPHSALSLYQGPLLYLTILQTICVVSLLIFSRKIKNYLTDTGYVLVLAGGVSNLLDRAINANKILDGAVIDMIKLFDLVTINLADILITLGVLTIFLKKETKR
jgi:lipoprotein signal peptidase